MSGELACLHRESGTGVCWRGKPAGGAAVPVGMVGFFAVKR